MKRVDTFIADWHEFADAHRLPAYEDLNPPPSSAPLPDEDSYGVPSKRPRGNSKKELVAEVAREIIQRAGEPVSRSELFRALTSKGLRIEGTDPEMVLSTMLWRMKDRIVRLPQFGYWIADKEYVPAGYDPSAPYDGDAESAEMAKRDVAGHLPEIE